MKTAALEPYDKTDRLHLYIQKAQYFQRISKVLACSPKSAHIAHGGVMTERATVMIFCVTTPLNKKFRNSFMFAIIHFTDEVAFDLA